MNLLARLLRGADDGSQHHEQFIGRCHEPVRSLDGLVGMDALATEPMMREIYNQEVFVLPQTLIGGDVDDWFGRRVRHT